MEDSAQEDIHKNELNIERKWYTMQRKTNRAVADYERGADDDGNETKEKKYHNIARSHLLKILSVPFVPSKHIRNTNACLDTSHMRVLSLIRPYPDPALLPADFTLSLSRFVYDITLLSYSSDDGRAHAHYLVCVVRFNSAFSVSIALTYQFWLPLLAS